MVINSSNNLQKALLRIGNYKKKEFLINSIESYGRAKWDIIDSLNLEYESILEKHFDLYNWINHDINDEVSYFLNEVGSNILNYSEFSLPSHFYLWEGKKGFVIGIEQQGKGFNAELINSEKFKKNEGAGFEFLRNCNKDVFFDDSKNAKIVYFEYLF